MDPLAAMDTLDVWRSNSLGLDVAGKDKEPEQTWASKVTGPFAATLAAALMLSASLPEDAMAARSGGRVGGSSFSARRAAPPPRAAPRASPR